MGLHLVIDNTHYVEPRNPLATDGLNWPVVYTMLAIVGFWAVIAALCLLFPVVAEIVWRIIASFVGFGLLAAIVLDWRH